tara:strand:+ start:64145 stop:64558 length:414 start_codon:yes stop_codon:yes gene_type:complete
MPACIKGPSKATRMNLAMNNVNRLTNEIATLLQTSSDNSEIIDDCAAKIVCMLKQINVVRKQLPMQLEFVYLTQIVRRLPDVCLVAFNMAVFQEQHKHLFSGNIDDNQRAMANAVGVRVHQILRPCGTVKDTREPGI